jgi:hypothetical protein
LIENQLSERTTKLNDMGTKIENYELRCATAQLNEWAELEDKPKEEINKAYMVGNHISSSLPSRAVFERRPPTGASGFY